jgi:tetratricopeptide (TPR) repeat protein
MRANRLWAKGALAEAEVLYREVLDRDPTDWFARLMLSNCCERQRRLAEALTLAEECALREPPSLFALQAAIRLALAIEEHDKVDAYVRRALALPEVQNEIPKEIAFPRVLLAFMRTLAKLPWLRRRIRHEEIAQMELGVQTQQLKEWKTWALEYLAWRAGVEPGSTTTQDLVH